MYTEKLKQTHVPRVIHYILSCAIQTISLTKICPKSIHWFYSLLNGGKDSSMSWNLFRARLWWILRGEITYASAYWHSIINPDVGKQFCLPCESESWLVCLAKMSRPVSGHIFLATGSPCLISCPKTQSVESTYSPFLWFSHSVVKSLPVFLVTWFVLTKVCFLLSLFSEAMRVIANDN